jgi:dTDP-L-rhamnose 4-epimerase
MKSKKKPHSLSVVARGDIDRVLITGGAGFIGSHLARRLLAEGYHVRALDNLTPQVHGENAGRPAYLDPAVELVVGDIRDRAVVAQALDGCDAVVHLAACVGVGQSMYEIVRYASVNTEGTGVLLQEMIDRPIRKLLVASSMSIYGEGLYRDQRGRMVESATRTREQLERRAWEPEDADGGPLTPLPTPESKRPALSSIYALGKYDQERMCLLFGDTYRIPTVALRFFNVYGPDQALSNPYTGVLAIFAGRLLNNKAPLIFEDGRQRRDFVSVHDVVQGLVLALERSGADGLAVNLGSGENVSILEVAQRLGTTLDRDQVMPALTGKYRVGDIRHCFADVTRARECLGYEPQVTLEQGIAELATWLEGQVADDRVDSAAAELQARGLTR